MLLPQELKKENFSKVMRGYNTVEVDEYIAFVNERYSELYRENNELERKLRAALAKIDESSSNEDEIKKVIVNARNIADKIIGETNERADVLIESAMNRCNAILSDFAAKMKKSKEVISLMKKEVDTFKTGLYVKYNDHIEKLEQLTEFLELSGDVNEYTSKVIDGIKRDLEESISENSMKYFPETDSDSYSNSMEDDVYNADIFEDFEELNTILKPQPLSDTETADTMEEEDDDMLLGGTPDGDFIPEQNDYLYEDDEQFTHTLEQPVVSSAGGDNELAVEDADDFVAHAKLNLFGKKNNSEKANKNDKQDPLSLTDEFELVYSNDDDVLI